MVHGSAENLQDMTHADFAAGMRDGMLACWLGAPSRSATGRGRLVFNVLFLAYSVGPMILVPLWAYHLGNWWLLIGIPVSYFGTASAGQSSGVIFWFGCYWIGFVIHSGLSIYDYTTYHFLCAVSGFMLYQLSDTALQACARRSLIDDPELFDNARAENRIRIVRLDSSGHEILMPEDIAAAIDERNLEPLKPFPSLLRVTNIVAEAFTYVFGVFTGIIGTVDAHRKGIDNLSPDTADSIARQLTNGTIGTVAIALGCISSYSGVWGGCVALVLLVAANLCVWFNRRKAATQ